VAGFRSWVGDLDHVNKRLVRSSALGAGAYLNAVNYKHSGFAAGMRGDN
jgi:hypothetical protein